MKAGIRQMVSAVQKLTSEKDSDVVKCEGIQHNIASIKESFDVYSSSYLAFAAATRNLLSQISSLYPNNGPLHPALHMLAETSMEKEKLQSTLEMQKGLIIVPMEGIHQLTNTLIENIHIRDRVAGEREHYINKVGKLIHESTVKQKLKDNQTKLSIIMNQHSTLVQQVSEASGVLENDMVAILTPTLSQFLKMQKSYYENEIMILQQSLDDYKNRPLPSRSIPTVTETSTTKPSENVTSFTLPSRSDTSHSSSTETSGNVHPLPVPVHHHSKLPSIPHGGIVLQPPTTTAVSSSNTGSAMPVKPTLSTNSVSAPILSSIPPISVSPMNATKTNNSSLFMINNPSLRPVNIKEKSVATPVLSTSSSRTVSYRNNLPKDYDIVQAIAPYTATVDGDVSFKEDDTFIILRKDESGWWDSRFRGDYGVCPSNYVRSLVVSGNDLWMKVRIYGIAKVQYDHIPEESSELPIHINDTVYLLESLDNIHNNDNNSTVSVSGQWILGCVPENFTNEGEATNEADIPMMLTVEKQRIGYVPYNYLKNVTLTTSTSTTTNVKTEITPRQSLRILSSTNVLPTSESSKSTPVMDQPYKGTKTVGLNQQTTSSTASNTAKVSNTILGKNNSVTGTSSSSTEPSHRPIDRSSVLSGIEGFNKSVLKKTPNHRNTNNKVPAHVLRSTTTSTNARK